MENFVFYNPTKLIFGKGTIKKIGQEIAAAGFKKILLMAGGGSIKRNKVYIQVAVSLKKAKVKWVECWGIRPNPALSKVRQMICIAKKEKVDALLAVGGGSVIDSGKSVAAGMYTKDVWLMFEDGASVTKAMPLFTVLTISATGTEMNPYAVLTNEDENKKWNISGPALYPKVSVVDPSVQQTLPWNQTVNGALDALSHIMEYYFKDGVSETVLSLDESLFRTIVKIADNLKRNADDYHSRANFAWAATLALNGISGAGQAGGDWAAHGIEHSISALHPDVAHGAGLGVIFPAWIERCKNVNSKIFKRWAKNMWSKDSVKEGVEAFRTKIKSWKGATTLKELGVDESEIDEIADNTVKSGMAGSVKRLSKRDIVNILKIAFSG